MQKLRPPPLYLLLCLPIRFLLALCPLYWPSILLLVAYVSIAFGFLGLYFTGWRKTGVETGGQPIWWRPYRLLHGLTYLLAAYFVYAKQGKWATLVLLFDLMFSMGLSALRYLF